VLQRQIIISVLTGQLALGRQYRFRAGLGRTEFSVTGRRYFGVLSAVYGDLRRLNSLALSDHAVDWWAVRELPGNSDQRQACVRLCACAAASRVPETHAAGCDCELGWGGNGAVITRAGTVGSPRVQRKR